MDNKRITPARTFMDVYKPFDESISENYNKKIENDKILKESVMYDKKVIERSEDEAEVSRFINERVMDDARASLKSRVQSQLLKETLGEILYRSLPLDEEYKSNYKDAIGDFIVKECMDLYGNYSNMRNTLITESTWLDSLFTGIDYVVEAAVEGKLEDDNVLKVDDLKSYDKCKVLMGELDKDISIDEVNKIIKDKVINVVKDEQENSAKRQKIADEIATEVSGSQVSENYISANILNEKHTLFKSISIKVSRSFLKESTDKELKMDYELITSEAILEYAMLETLNTLKIHKFRKCDVIDMASENIHNINN